MGVKQSLALLGTIFGLSLGLVAPVWAFDWASLWSSAEQRAARQFEKQQYDELINNAPNADWRGLSEYRNGDYAAAAKSFEQQRRQAEEAALSSDVDRAMYNQANAHVLEENYQAAMNLFNELLESDPQHANAQHNRDIAQQLLEQQQQQSGEQGEQSDENQSESDGEQEQQEDQQEDQQGQQQDQESGEGEQSESQNPEQGEEQEQNGQSSEQQSKSNSQGSDSDSEDASASAAEEQAEQDAAAAAAMQAERERQANEQQTENAGATERPEPVAPLTEREQANEQWLRQIPDDPAGLLERKIEHRHNTDFPKVLNSDKPW